MLEFLKKLIERKKKEVSAIELRIKESDSADEVRELGGTLKTLRDEITEAEEQIAELEAQDEGNDGEGEEGNDGDAEGRSAFNPSEANLRSIQRFVTGTPEQVEARGSMEYRMAFKEYIQTGERSDVLQYEKRAGATTGTSSDLGVLIPTTVIQEIIKGVEGVYGQLYADVKKTNLPGGVKYPIGSFDAEFKRIAETTVSDRQKGGSITGSVEFSYKIGEVRLARTLLQTVLSVEVFEQEFAKVVVKAYVKAMDKEIMLGDDDNGECVGILTEANKGASGRIPAANVIEMSAADVADWTKWQEKVFAKIPLGMRKEKIKMVCTANTYEANLKTLKDDNNRPVYAETFNPVDGNEKCTFKGKEVTLVEEDVLENFNDASDGDYFGMLWVPEKAYGINSNLEFTVIDYFDHETNQTVKKAIVINDGKILDPEFIYLLKKDA